MEAALRPLKERVKAIFDTAPVVPSFGGYLWFKATHSETLSKYRNGDRAIVDAMKRDGFVVLHNHYSEDFCKQAVDDIESIFETKPQYVRQSNDMRIFGAEELSSTVTKFHSEKWLNDLSSHYSCAKTATVFTLASRVAPDIWEDSPAPTWHRDLRYRQFKAFLYLAEVNVDNGPIQVVRRSHCMPQYLRDVHAGPLPFTSNSFSDDQIARIVRDDPSRLTTITGGAGTLILADVGMLHRGSPPRSGRRYALTNYYFEKAYITRDRIVSAFNPVNVEKTMDLLKTW